MQEVTPDLIAQVATRLFRDAGGLPAEAPQHPTTHGLSVPSVPSGGPLPSPAGMPGLPVGTSAPSFPAVPTLPGVQATPVVPAAGTIPLPATTTLPFTPSGFAPNGLPVSPTGTTALAAIPGVVATTPGITPTLTAAIPSSTALPVSVPSIPSAAPSLFAPSFALPAVVPTSPTALPGFALPVGSVPAVSPTNPPSPALAAVPSTWTPGGVVAPPVTEVATGRPPANDGLKAFIAQIRAEDYRNASLLCPEQQAQRSGGTKPAPTGPRPLDVAAIRRDFPALNQLIHGKPLVWLDNAATTQKPQRVIDALAQFYARDNSNIHRAAHTLAARATDGYEGARQTIQRFLGAASPEEIVFVRGTTEGINLVANTYGKKHLQPGDEIVLTTLEHHANIVPWQMLAREKGLTIRVVPVNDRGEILLEAYQALLGPRTKLVALTHASNSLGTILPVHEMTTMAKRVGAAVLIDGAQTVAHIAVNVQALDCDFYVFSGHKIFGPTGIGAVYGKRAAWEDLPPWQGGGNMIRNVTFEETTYSDPPARFEAGTPNIADAIGLAAALDYVQQFGLANIAAYEHALLEYATDKLVGIPGLRLIGTAREKVGVLSFVLKDRRVEDVGRLLDLEGIAVRAGHHCSQPSLRRFGLEATVRPSLSFYNTHAEIDRLADAVRRIAQ